MVDELTKLRVENAIKHINMAIEDLCDVSIEDFHADSLKSRAVSFSLVQIGEQLNQLKAKIGNEHPEIAWSYVKSMRNVLVHDYVEVDLLRVYETVKKDLPTLKNQLEKLLD